MASVNNLITIKFEIKKHKPAQPDIESYILEKLINEYFERINIMISKFSFKNCELNITIKENKYEEIPHIIDFPEMKVCLLLLDSQVDYYYFFSHYRINFF
jgi:hypothetical protein